MFIGICEFAVPFFLLSYRMEKHELIRNSIAVYGKKPE